MDESWLQQRPEVLPPVQHLLACRSCHSPTTADLYPLQRPSWRLWPDRQDSALAESFPVRLHTVLRLRAITNGFLRVWLQRYDRDKERLEKEEISEKRWKANMKRTESTAEYWVYGPSETGPAQLYGGIVEAEDQPESTTLD